MVNRLATSVAGNGEEELFRHNPLPAFPLPGDCLKSAVTASAMTAVVSLTLLITFKIESMRVVTEASLFMASWSAFAKRNAVARFSL